MVCSAWRRLHASDLHELRDTGCGGDGESQQKEHLQE